MTASYAEIGKICKFEAGFEQVALFKFFESSIIKIQQRNVCFSDKNQNIILL